MGANDLTIEILTSIRDEIRSTNRRLDSTNERIERLDLSLTTEIRSTNERLDETNVRLERLERRQTESEIRLATGLTAVAGAVHEVRDLLKGQGHYGKTLTDHEKRISILERR